MGKTNIEMNLKKWKKIQDRRDHKNPKDLR